jgi:rare lipoprotein A
VAGERYDVLPSSEGYVERGIASWYGPDFHGLRASSGETYDMYGMTAAHPVLPLPTYVQVTNLTNGRKAIVRVNDRGPFHSNRVIDLSYAAAHKLGIVQDGTGLVEVRALNPSRPPTAPMDKVILSARPNLFVQVGAFSEFHNAERLRAHLASLDVSGIHIQPSADIGDPFYRVRIGPLASVTAADFLTKRLEGLGWRDYRVVVD